MTAATTSSDMVSIYSTVRTLRRCGRTVSSSISISSNSESAQRNASPAAQHDHTADKSMVSYEHRRTVKTSGYSGRAQQGAQDEKPRMRRRRRRML